MKKELTPMRGAGPARRALKMNQDVVATRAGLDRSVYSRYESGDRAMPKHDAEKLAPVLKSEPMTILFDNRREMFLRAREAGDAEGVLKSVQSALKITEGGDLSPEGEGALDELLTAAEGFFDALAKKSYQPQPGEAEGFYPLR